MAILEEALDFSWVEELSCRVDCIVVEDALVCADRCWDAMNRADACSDSAKEDEAFACSCIWRRLTQAEVTGPCVEAVLISDAARAARAELLDAATAAAVLA